MTQMTGEFPRPIAPPVWLTARARNAMHRPRFITAVGLGTFLAASAALLLTPQRATRVDHSLPAPIKAPPDTVALLAALTQARTRLEVGDSSLSVARVRVAADVPPQVDSLAPQRESERDSLSRAVTDLGALLTRAESAPLLASYRALAGSPEVAADPRVEPLLDSLTAVDRARDALGPTAIGTSAYRELNTRATEIGQAIDAVGQERRAQLRQQVGSIVLLDRHQSPAQSPASDTSAWVTERDSAQSLVNQATSALSAARGRARDDEQRVREERGQVELDASRLALLVAALVVGGVLGFGAAFIGEVRHPRVSDEHEIERVTGARVLATVKPRPRMADRMRRFADEEAPPYFDPGADGYQLTYLHVARTGASRLMLTVAGEETSVAAIVATNFAAIAADEARSTVIIDTDSRTLPVAAALRTHAEPGLVDIVERRVSWTDATSQVRVGRDRMIDVIPSGISTTGNDPADVIELFRQEASRLSRHYEAIVIVATIEQMSAGLPGAMPIHDTILCARVGHTRIADLQAALAAVRQAGGTALGIVLWNASRPSLPTPDRIARSPRPLRTAEMRALTGAR